MDIEAHEINTFLSHWRTIEMISTVSTKSYFKIITHRLVLAKSDNGLNISMDLTKNELKTTVFKENHEFLFLKVLSSFDRLQYY